MKLKVIFKEQNSTFKINFGNVIDTSDGGYVQGYNDGLAQRKYETWTFTLTDGTVIEKQIALL